MGLAEDIQKAVQEGMSSLDNIRKTFTFIQRTPGEYDPAVGEVEIAETEVSVRGVLARFRSFEVRDLDLLKTGRKGIIPTLEFGSVVPDSLEDQCEVDGQRYKVADIQKDPADAVYIFTLVAVEDT